MSDTALTIIEEALREIRVLARDETADDDLANDVRAKLNDMLDSWSIEKILCFVQAELTFNLTANGGTYTIGPSGADFTATRPRAVTHAWVRKDSRDYPLMVVGEQRWDERPTKSTSGWPTVLRYRASYPNGVFLISDPPQEALELHLVVDQPLTTFATLATAYSFPPGYKRALVTNLAVDRAPSFGKKPSDELKEIAIATKDTIRRMNLPEVVATCDAELNQSGGGFNIYRGY